METGKQEYTGYDENANHIQEIFPIYFAKRKTIDEEEHKLRNLATRVKGTILYDVQGRKAMDFEW